VHITGHVIVGDFVKGIPIGCVYNSVLNEQCL
jgi:hypothetical protein